MFVVVHVVGLYCVIGRCTRHTVSDVHLCSRKWL